ncbi:MAG: 30S ribosome-binding factor RbfA [Pseudomonadota bacterium]
MTKQTRPEAGQRQLRVGEEIRHVLAEIIARGELRDPALSGRPITVTEVRMSRDLRYATVFVLPLGGEETDEVIAGLDRAKPFLRSQIGRQVRLRFTPDLTFRADRGYEYAARIDQLLKDSDGA